MDLAGSITDNLSVIASYGYTDAKVLEDPDYAGKPLPNVPKHTGSLFLTYDIHNVYNSNTLTVGGGVSRGQQALRHQRRGLLSAGVCGGGCVRRL